MKLAIIASLLIASCVAQETDNTVYEQHYIQARDAGYGAPEPVYGAPSGSYGAPSPSYGGQGGAFGRGNEVDAHTAVS